MEMVTQYAFAGDHTGRFSCLCMHSGSYASVVEALEKAIAEVAQFDGGGC